MRSSPTSGTTPPTTADAWARWATTARNSAPGPRRGSTAGARSAGATASSRPSWRNVQVKSREVNDLHKRMLRVSAKVAALPPGLAREGALDDLLRGQSND